jgi:hypothetical protein
MILSWYYILAFFLLFGLISYFYRSFRIKEGAKKKFDREIWYVDDSDNGEYYYGRITKRNRDGTYDVEYSDGERAKNIDADWIEPNPKKEVSSPDTKSPTIKYLNNIENDRVIKKEYENLGTCYYLSIKDYVLNGSCERSNGSLCPSKSYNIKNCSEKNINNCNGAFVCGNCKGQSEPCAPLPEDRIYYMYVGKEACKTVDKGKGGIWEEKDSRCYVK